MSAQAEAGNVKVVRGPWNDEFLRVLESFPVGKRDDEVDGLSGAHEVLCNVNAGGASFRRVEIEGQDEYRTASMSPRGRILV